MKIGIVVHSLTGNTYSVAEKLQACLRAAGHETVIERVEAVKDDEPDAGKIILSSAPDISSYEALIFGGPVRGFALSPVLAAYLQQLPSLQGKKVEGYVTEQLPYPWMGGSRAIKQMQQLLNAKGAQLAGTGVINWSNKKRQEQIDQLAARQPEMFTA